MNFLIILLLSGAVVWLWQQVETLKRRVRQLEDASSGQDYIAQEYRAQDHAGEEEPRPSVVFVDRKAEDDTLRSDQIAEPDPPIVEPEPEPEPDAVAAFAASHHDTAEPPPFEHDAAADRTLRRPQFDIEDIFGRKLPIWVGGITLAIAGILLVRYSIEAGLMTPPVRVAMAFLFGVALLAGAEFAYRRADLVNDARICQALAGAGLATLYAGFYLAGTQYGLIGQTFAFLGLASVTAGAIALSFRFGLPCAILGLVGGFAAPLLVGGEEANLPLLTIYLGLVTAGLSQAGERQGRPWLSIAALAGGLGWGVLLLVSEDFGTAEVLALGFYLVILGAVVPALVTGGSFGRPVRLASAVLASLQLALLVDRAGDGWLAWALYLLMGAALAALAWKRRELREGSAAAMVIAVGLLTQWDPAVGTLFYVIGTAIAVVFMVIPVIHLRRGDDTLADRGQIVAGPLALAVGIYAVTGRPGADVLEVAPALCSLALALIPAVSGWLMRASTDRANWFAAYAGASAALLFGAGLLVSPSWMAPILASIILAGLWAIASSRSDRAAFALLGGAGVIAVLTLPASSGIEDEIQRLAEGSEGGLHIRSVLRWGAVALGLGLLAWKPHFASTQRAAQAGAALAAYGLAAQILPWTVLPWLVALSAIGLAFAPFARPHNLVPARLMLGILAASWAVVPLAEWLEAGLEAAAGNGPLAFRWPQMDAAILRILPFAAVMFALPRFASLPRQTGPLVGASLLLVTLHILYKQVFAIETETAFIETALAERTIWEALLLAGAFAASRALPARYSPAGDPRMVSVMLAGLALAHAVWFTGAVHNPLFAAQAVGPVPIANLALAAGVVSLGAIWHLRETAALRLRQALDGLAMIVIVVTALALLRQVFAGSILVSQPMGQAEDLLRSVLGIVLAIVFLVLGRIRDEQSWRIGSLVLMVLAVAKVFLVDAAALEGLLRIASFMALGFSLLGIGWLYARQFGPRKQADAPA